MNWYFKVSIMGDDWTMYLVDDDDAVIAGEDSGAETDPETKEIYFRRGEVTIQTILHELWHAYFSYTHTNTAGLDENQMEEVSAELFAYNAIKILDQANNVYKQLIELRDNNGSKV